MGGCHRCTIGSLRRLPSRRPKGILEHVLSLNLNLYAAFSMTG